MPDVWALDTNVYIEALRNRAELMELKAFLRDAGGRVVVNAVVAMELHAGARTEEDVADLRALIGAYRERGLLLRPGLDAFLQAGRVLAALRLPTRVAAGGTSIVADALLAASCREAGVVLVTRNAHDFVRIQRQLRGFRFVAPWPPRRR